MHSAPAPARAPDRRQQWLLAIDAGQELVGLVLLFLDTDKAEYGVWRLLIAAAHQRKGYGRQAMELAIEHVRTLPNAREIVLSYVPGPADPSDFYRRLGFEETERVEHGEQVMRLTL